MTNVTATYNADKNTLDVTYRGDTRTFPATYVLPGQWAMASSVFAGRFNSGTKVWPMRVYYWFDSGRTVVESGVYSNKGGAHILVGWYDGVNDAYRTQYRGRR